MIEQEKRQSAGSLSTTLSSIQITNYFINIAQRTQTCEQTTKVRNHFLPAKKQFVSTFFIVKHDMNNP